MEIALKFILIRDHRKNLTAMRLKESTFRELEPLLNKPSSTPKAVVSVFLICSTRELNYCRQKTVPSKQDKTNLNILKIKRTPVS